MINIATRSPNVVLIQLSRFRNILGGQRQAYVLAWLLVAGAFALVALAGPGFNTPYLFLIPGVLVAGIVGGRGPGL